MIPTKEALESVVIEPQLHSRYALGTPFVEKGTQGQMIYYVELSSAPYVFSFDLDTKYIGKLTFSYEKVGELAVDNDEERKKRIDVTLDSLKLFLTEMMFGAKKTRFLPIIDWESVVIAISDDVWTVPSPLSANYITNTLNKLDKTENANTNKEESSSNGTELFVYINPIVFEDTTIYVEKKTEELLNSFYKALDEFKKKLEERGDANLIDWNEFKKKKLEELLENKIDELTASSDLKYASVIQEKYIKTKKELEAKGIAVYESFEECVSDAIKKAKEKEDEN
jgi:CRISPR/Cas system-associated protein Cas7 (RAMP superfamily)